MQKHLTGAKLQGIDIIWPKVTHNFNLKDYNEKVRGKEVKNLVRIGKYIILNLDNKLIAVHLRMTGKLYVQPKSFDKKKHTQSFLFIQTVNRAYLMKILLLVQHQHGVLMVMILT